MDFTGRPAQLILIASVARRYYLEGKSKIEIAEELGLSRFKVARLLETARQVPPASATRWRNNACGAAFSVLMQVPVAAGRWARSLALGKKCFYLNLVRTGKHLLANLVN